MLGRLRDRRPRSAPRFSRLPRPVALFPSPMIQSAGGEIPIELLAFRRVLRPADGRHLLAARGVLPPDARASARARATPTGALGDVAGHRAQGGGAMVCTQHSAV